MLLLALVKLILTLKKVKAGLRSYLNLFMVTSALVLHMPIVMLIVTVGAKQIKSVETLSFNRSLKRKSVLCLYMSPIIVQVPVALIVVLVGLGDDVMSETYADPNNIFDLPVTSDNSLSHVQLIKLFSRQFRPFLNSTINKYLFSCGNNWLCIEPLRIKYRVIGQYNDMQYVKRCSNFDVYFVGSLSACIDYFCDVLGR